MEPLLLNIGNVLWSRREQMNKLINNLINWYEEDKEQLITFEDIANGKYSEKSSDRIEKNLQTLASTGILKYVSLEVGFRIEIIQMQDLKEILVTLNAIDNADDEMKKLLNDIALEIKDKSPNEAKQIIMEYHQRLNELNNEKFL